MFYFLFSIARQGKRRVDMRKNMHVIRKAPLIIAICLVLAAMLISCSGKNNESPATGTEKNMGEHVDDIEEQDWCGFNTSLQTHQTYLYNPVQRTIKLETIATETGKYIVVEQ